MPLGFDVRCFYDDNFDLTIDDIYIDSVSIGADVYLEIKENKQIPNNLEFFLKDCTGYNDINDPKSYADASFPFVQVRTNQRDEIFIWKGFELNDSIFISIFRICAMQIWWEQTL